VNAARQSGNSLQPQRDRAIGSDACRSTPDALTIAKRRNRPAEGPERQRRGLTGDYERKCFSLPWLVATT
jgi:hypothetical protein